MYEGYKHQVSSAGRQTLVTISRNLAGSWIKQFKLIILSYDHSGKYLFHLHQTVFPKNIILVMIIEAKKTKTVKREKVERTSSILSYDYSGKYLFHLHQTVIPKHNYSHDYRRKKNSKKEESGKDQLLLYFIILSYDYSGKCLFHLHQTVIPKYIIIVMIIEAKKNSKKEESGKTSYCSNSSF